MSRTADQFARPEHVMRLPRHLRAVLTVPPTEQITRTEHGPRPLARNSRVVLTVTAAATAGGAQ